MADNSNFQWITIHPNNAKEGNGVHVKINKDTHEIVAGNKHLLEGIAKKGGNVAPEALKPSFTAPKDEDLDWLNDDNESSLGGFKTPSDEDLSWLNDEGESGEGDKKNAGEQKELVKEWMDTYLAHNVTNICQVYPELEQSEAEQIIKDVLDEHPDFISKSEHSGGATIHNHSDEFTSACKEKAEAILAKKNKLAKWKADTDNYNHVVKAYAQKTGLPEEVVAKTIDEIVTANPDYLTPLGEGLTPINAFHSDVEKKLSEIAKSSGATQKTGFKIGQEEKDKLTDVLLDYGKYNHDIDEFWDAVANGDANYPLKATMFSPLKSEYGLGDPLLKKIAAALGIHYGSGAENQETPTETPKFTQEQIDAFANPTGKYYALAWKDFIQKYPEEFDIKDGEIVVSDGFNKFIALADLAAKYKKEDLANTDPAELLESFKEHELGSAAHAMAVQYGIKEEDAQKDILDLVSVYPQYLQKGNDGHGELTNEAVKELHKFFKSQKNAIKKAIKNAEAWKNKYLESASGAFAGQYEITPEQAKAIIEKVLSEHPEYISKTKNGPIITGTHHQFYIDAIEEEVKALKAAGSEKTEEPSDLVGKWKSKYLSAAAKGFASDYGISQEQAEAIVSKVLADHPEYVMENETDGVFISSNYDNDYVAAIKKAAEALKISSANGNEGVELSAGAKKWKDQFGDEIASEIANKHNIEQEEAKKILGDVIASHQDFFNDLGLKSTHNFGKILTYCDNAANVKKWKDYFLDSWATNHAGGQVSASQAKDIIGKIVDEHPEFFAESQGGKIGGVNSAYHDQFVKLVKDAIEGKNSPGEPPKNTQVQLTTKDIEDIKNELMESGAGKKNTDGFISGLLAGKPHKYSEAYIEKIGETYGKDSELYKKCLAIMNGANGDLVSEQNPTPTTKPPTPPKPFVKSNWNGDTTGGHKFPATMDELNGLTKVKSLGGASGANATLYKDADGNQYVMKRFEASDKAGQARLKEECDADTYYLAGGATVPHFKLYGDEKTGYVKLSRYIPGTKQLGAVWSNATPEMREKIKTSLQKNFALDVMAGAWDVLGTGQDNILVDSEGNVIRCDNGGAFNRRAQGGEKSHEQWGNGHIDDLWTMRGLAAGLDGKTVPDGTGKKDFFGDISTHQLLSDIVSRDWDAMIAHLPPATKAVMEKRIAHAKDYHGMCNNVVVDGKYGDGKHSEDLTLNYHCLNKFGAMAGCTNENLGPGNWGFCRGDGGSNPKPTLSKFFNEDEPKIEDFTNAPEPKLEDFMPSSNTSEAANVLLTAAKSINHHCYDGNDKPNANSIEAVFKLKPKLEAVAKGSGANAAKAKEMLAYVGKIEDLKAKGFPKLTEKLENSPSGAVDLNTPEAKESANAAFAKSHSEWETKIGDAKNQLAIAHQKWEQNKAVAEQKLADAVKDWEVKTGGQGFGFKNLTDCYMEFCKSNGIDGNLFWEMAKSQGYSSQQEGSSRMKVLEILAMGGNLNDVYKSVDGVSDHTTAVKIAADEFKSNPSLHQKYAKAYNAMKALTQMLLRQSSFTGNDSNKGVVRMCRTESKTKVCDNYGLKKGTVVNYPMGTHESFGVFNTVTVYGNNQAMICDVPYSRISSVYFLLSPTGDSMYLGDGENEAGVNAVGLPKYYWKTVSAGLPITGAYALADKAFKVKTPLA